jgi:hypothetical protein
MQWELTRESRPFVGPECLFVCVCVPAYLCSDGKVLPWELIEKNIRATHPYEVFALAAMLSVPYFEKALYELPEDKLTPEEVIALADRTEVAIEGGLSPRCV